MCVPPGILCLTPSPSRLPAGSRSTSTPTASCLTRRISWPCRWALPPHAMTRTTPQLFGSRGTPLWEAVCVGVVLAWAAGGLGAGTPNPHPAPCWGCWLGGWAGAGWAQHPTESSLPPASPVGLGAGSGARPRPCATSVPGSPARPDDSAAPILAGRRRRVFLEQQKPLCAVRAGRKKPPPGGRRPRDGCCLLPAACALPALPARSHGTAAGCHVHRTPLPTGLSFGAPGVSAPESCVCGGVRA